MGNRKQPPINAKRAQGRPMGSIGRRHLARRLRQQVKRQLAVTRPSSGTPLNDEPQKGKANSQYQIME